MTDETQLISDDELRELLELIYTRYHYDFRRYAKASLKRRVGLAISHLGGGTARGLARRLESEPDAMTGLLHFFTVQVSDMFRDPAFFRTFRETVVPVLRTYPSLKLWVAGCSTGEELYSYAIILREEGLLDRSILYATDINGEALRKAEAGIYALDRVAGFTDNHRQTGATVSLSTHYTAAYGAAAFDRSLRKSVVFSDHSLATDNVFAEVHVVSIRNVLIYFDRELQDRALGLAKDALVRRGFFGLGSKESLDFSSHASAFKRLSGTWFQRC